MAYDLKGAVINEVYSPNVYPTSGGASIGIQASALSGYHVSGVPMGGDDMSMAAPAATQQMMPAAAGSPAMWWLVIAIALFVLMFVAKRIGSEGSDFSNIKLTVYNVLVIAFAAVIGLTLLKAGAAKVKVPGLSQLILSA